MSLIPLVIFSIQVVVAGIFNPFIIFVGWIVFLASYGVVVIWNDIADEKIDKANNRKDTPLATGLLTQHEAKFYLIISSIVASLSAFLLHPFALIWVGIYLVFGWLYSGRPKFKDRSFLALTILALCYGIMPWVLGLVTTSTPVTTEIIIVIVASFVFVFSIISLKDFRDYEGDKKYKKMTVLVTYGKLRTHQIIVTGTSLAYIILTVLCFSRQLYLLAFAGLILATLNFSILNQVMTNTHFRNTFGKISRVFFFLFAIIVYALIVL